MTFKPTLYKAPAEIEAKIPLGNQLVRAEQFAIQKELNRKFIQDQEEEELRNAFKPQIGRGPIGKKRSDRQAIHDHLYNYKNIYDNKKEVLKMYHDDLRAKSVSLNVVSENLVETCINDKLAKLFTLIDENKDG